MGAFAAAALIVFGATELPRSPCDAREKVAQILTTAASGGDGELDPQLATLDGLLGYSLLRGAPAGKDVTAPRRAEVAIARLGSLCASRAATKQGARHSGVDAERLRSILDRPEFDGARDRKGDVIGALMRRFWEWFTGLFETRAMKTGASMTRVLVLALAGAVAVFGLLRLRTLRRRSKRVLAAHERTLPLVLDDPSSHLGRARDALTQDARLAIREGLLALLSTLERQRWARPDRVKTNRELALELPGRGAPSDVSAQVEAMIRWYDRTFYSLAPVPPDEARRFIEEIAQFEGRLAARGGG